jgi:hypothetical protein
MFRNTPPKAADCTEIEDRRPGRDIKFQTPEEWPCRGRLQGHRIARYVYLSDGERVSQSTWAGKLKIPIRNRTTHTMPLSRLDAE